MNLILTGLMGSGKTTIGKLVVQKLRRDFVDTDEYLNKHYGPAEKILSQPDGDALFAETETKIARELSSQSNLVISTGGRFMLNQANIDLMNRNGYIICLAADLDELVERLLHADSDTYRPRFVRAEDKRELMRDLERQSEPFFSQFVQIRTDGIAPEEITDTVIGLYLTHKGETPCPMS